MDPYLERPELWPDVHNGLIAAVRDTLAPRLRPRYIVALEERVYVEDAGGTPLVGRPDLTVVASTGQGSAGARTTSPAAVVEVELPVPDRVRETYLEVRAVVDGDVVTVIGVLSPTNKRPGEGRRLYVQKRAAVLGSLTSLVEIDLLRAGDRMPLVTPPPACDYAVLVSRSWQRPRAHLLPFFLLDPIPLVPIPLRRGEDEPFLELGEVLSGLYDRAGYDLRVDYRSQPPDPPIADADRPGVETLLRGGGRRGG
jgi:hypothetical protein